MSKESMDKVLLELQAMSELRSYLRGYCETLESQLQATIDKHTKTLVEMEKLNKMKGEAALNEDFELAVKCRN